MTICQRVVETVLDSIGDVGCNDENSNNQRNVSTKEEGEDMSKVLDEDTTESSLKTNNKIDQSIQGNVVRKSRQPQSLGIKKRVESRYWVKIQHCDHCRSWHQD